MRVFPALLLAASAFACSLAFAGPARTEGAPPAVLLDRVVARWHAPEMGGVAKPELVFERELAFQARIEALADPAPDPAPFSDRHVRAALDRHIAETLLASLPILPVPDGREIASRAEAARGVLEQRCGGRDKLIAAAKAEGIGSSEIDAFLRRSARASLYLERMVVPMLEPSDAELRALLRTGTTPFTGKPYDQVAPLLNQWVVGQRLNEATKTFFQTVRSRVVITIVRPR